MLRSMCLAVPGQIVSTEGQGLQRTGRVDFSGVQREVALAYVPEAELGDWVIVHVGFAISKLDQDEAAETLATLRELAALVE